MSDAPIDISGWEIEFPLEDGNLAHELLGYGTLAGSLIPVVVLSTKQWLAAELPVFFWVVFAVWLSMCGGAGLTSTFARWRRRRVVLTQDAIELREYGAGLLGFIPYDEIDQIDIYEDPDAHDICVSTSGEASYWPVASPADVDRFDSRWNILIEGLLDSPSRDSESRVYETFLSLVRQRVERVSASVTKNR